MLPARVSHIYFFFSYTPTHPSAYHSIVDRLLHVANAAAVVIEPFRSFTSRVLEATTSKCMFEYMLWAHGSYYSKGEVLGADITLKVLHLQATFIRHLVASKADPLQLKM